MIEFQGVTLTAEVKPEDPKAYEKMQPGDTALVFCSGCSRSFTWVCQNKGDVPPFYHSRNCKKNRYARYDLQGPQPCPTPSKRRYKTIEAAEVAFRGHTQDKGYGPQPYKCRCGNFHLGNANYVIITSVVD